MQCNTIAVAQFHKNRQRFWRGGGHEGEDTEEEQMVPKNESTLVA